MAESHPDILMEDRDAGNPPEKSAEEDCVVSCGDTIRKKSDSEKKERERDEDTDGTWPMQLLNWASSCSK